MRSNSFCGAIALSGVLCANAAGQSPAPQPPPPAVMREFRGVWVATVANMDWPSKPGLSSWDQQRELLAILDRAVDLGLNAIVFHVRPGGDAFYASPYEPWSQYITGRQGRAPEPPWDPLAFAVDAAHKRGIELHAWFNPYRAAYVRDTAIASTHIARAQPNLVKQYGRFLWMDPGSAEVRRRTIRAIVDVVKRYDVDGVHIDDYFYPYPEIDASGHTIDFPDADTYSAYKKAGGTLAKDDWRRANVDSMVAALYRGVHSVKPWVKVGISPFGIWRPGNPPQIRGLDAYATIYANSRLWLEKGWADYFAPQLYWQIRPVEQSFPALLDWWLSQNTKHRHVWPGLADYRVGEAGAGGSRFTAQEIVDQIDTIRARDNAQAGHIHFNMTALIKNPDSLAEKVASRYAEPAIVPASPWLGSKAPARPTATVGRDPTTGDLLLRMTTGGDQKVWLWTVRSLSRGTIWTTSVLPGWLKMHRLADLSTTRVIVTAVSRTGVESAEAAVDLGTKPPAAKAPTKKGRGGGSGS
jgi:uncharacterized lipoprotein YddW (UPF0748 family)